MDSRPRSDPGSEQPGDTADVGAPDQAAPGDRPTGPSGVHAARLRCDNCGRISVHRILRWDPRSQSPGRRWNGVARCRECGWTHPFEVAPPLEREFDLIISRGARSERRRVRLPAGTKLAVGERVPGQHPPLEIRKIAGRGGGARTEATVSAVASVWVVPSLEHRLAVSVVDGGHTQSFRWVVNPEAVVVVGESFRTDEGRVWVVAVRARGRSWRRPGDRFAAREVQRLYGRRTESPPAGRSDWSNVRGIPRSRQSSTSRSARRRSSPGLSRKRT